MPVYSPINMYRRACFPIALPMECVVKILEFCHSDRFLKWYLGVVLVCCSPIISEVELLFEVVFFAISYKTN